MAKECSPDRFPRKAHQIRCLCAKQPARLLRYGSEDRRAALANGISAGTTAGGRESAALG